MPKYFAFVSKDYLPSCVLWSRLLLGDLTRFNEQYIARTALNNFNRRQRNYLRDKNTNGQVEDFFGRKKNCSFKGRRNMQLDTFIVENWKDNKGVIFAHLSEVFIDVHRFNCMNSFNLYKFSGIFKYFRHFKN
jgi:hypothetical protein